MYSGKNQEYKEPTSRHRGRYDLTRFSGTGNKNKTGRRDASSSSDISEDMPAIPAPIDRSRQATVDRAKSMAMSRAKSKTAARKSKSKTTARKSKSRRRVSSDSSSSSSDSSSGSSIDSSHSQMNLKKTVRPLKEFAKNRDEMTRQMWQSVKGSAMRKIMPPALKSIPLDELQRMCMDEMAVMSKKRLRHLIDGEEMASSSDSDESESSIDDRVPSPVDAKREVAVPCDSTTSPSTRVVNADPDGMSIVVAGTPLDADAGAPFDPEEYEEDELDIELGGAPRRVQMMEADDYDGLVDDDTLDEHKEVDAVDHEDDGADGMTRTVCVRDDDTLVHDEHHEEHADSDHDHADHEHVDADWTMHAHEEGESDEDEERVREQLIAAMSTRVVVEEDEHTPISSNAIGDDHEVTRIVCIGGSSDTATEDDEEVVEDTSVITVEDKVPEVAEDTASSPMATTTRSKTTTPVTTPSPRVEDDPVANSPLGEAVPASSPSTTCEATTARSPTIDTDTIDAEIDDALLEDDDEAVTESSSSEEEVEVPLAIAVPVVENAKHVAEEQHAANVTESVATALATLRRHEGQKSKAAIAVSVSAPFSTSHGQTVNPFVTKETMSEETLEDDEEETMDRPRSRDRPTRGVPIEELIEGSTHVRAGDNIKLVTQWPPAKPKLVKPMAPTVRDDDEYDKLDLIDALDPMSSDDDNDDDDSSSSDESEREKRKRRRRRTKSATPPPFTDFFADLRHVEDGSAMAGCAPRPETPAMPVDMAAVKEEEDGEMGTSSEDEADKSSDDDQAASSSSSSSAEEPVIEADWEETAVESAKSTIAQREQQQVERIVQLLVEEDAHTMAMRRLDALPVEGGVERYDSDGEGEHHDDHDVERAPGSAMATKTPGPTKVHAKTPVVDMPVTVDHPVVVDVEDTSSAEVDLDMQPPGTVPVSIARMPEKALSVEQRVARMVTASREGKSNTPLATVRGASVVNIKALYTQLKAEREANARRVRRVMGPSLRSEEIADHMADRHKRHEMQQAVRTPAGPDLPPPDDLQPSTSSRVKEAPAVIVTGGKRTKHEMVKERARRQREADRRLKKERRRLRRENKLEEDDDEPVELPKETVEKIAADEEMHQSAMALKMTQLYQLKEKRAKADCIRKREKDLHKLGTSVRKAVIMEEVSSRRGTEESGASSRGGERSSSRREKPSSRESVTPSVKTPRADARSQASSTRIASPPRSPTASTSASTSAARTNAVDAKTEKLEIFELEMRAKAIKALLKHPDDETPNS